MKITKRQLRRIIKEEKARLQEYGAGDSPADSTAAEEELVDTVERIEQIIGEDAVASVLARMGYSR
jgi:hypothetical protein